MYLSISSYSLLSLLDYVSSRLLNPKMKFFALLAMASAAFAGVTNNNKLPRNIFDRRSCSGNNCNRAITGTAGHLPASTLRKSDCSSFLLTTVTPSPVYVPALVVLRFPVY